MKSRYILLITVGLVILATGIIFIKRGGTTTLTENKTKPASQEVVTPTPTPISFSYAASTDLKEELNSVSPEVQDSDFESLKNLLPSL
jgi:hypothetical protein